MTGFEIIDFANKKECEFGKNTGKSGLTITLRLNRKDSVFGKSIDIIRQFNYIRLLATGVDLAVESPGRMI